MAAVRTSDHLTVGTVYTREQLKAQFEITAASLNNGIFKPPGHKSVWLFVTKNKTADRTQYEDSYDGEHLHMQGQTLGRTDSLITDHVRNGNELLLFFRRDKQEFDHGGFRYEGPFEYVSHSGSLPTSFELKRIEGAPSRNKTTWELALDAIEALGGAATAPDILAKILSTKPDYVATNLPADLGMLSVNSPSRGNHGYNAKPRRTDGGSPYDRLFKRGVRSDVSYELYRPDKHGVWELYLDAGAKVPQVRLVNDGALSAEVSKAEVAAERSHAFDPANVEDAREKTLGAIVRRHGQPQFRQALLVAYDGRCAISRCAVPDVLEAAHIYPYKGAHTNAVSNGLLLRADLHTLFDLGLIRVDPETMQVRISSKLFGTDYGQLDGVQLHLPASAADHPSTDALKWHAGQSVAW